MLRSLTPTMQWLSTMVTKVTWLSTMVTKVTRKGNHGDDAEGNHVIGNGVIVPTADQEDTLQRTLGYRQGFVLTVGLILGSGVFMRNKSFRILVTLLINKLICQTHYA